MPSYDISWFNSFIHEEMKKEIEANPFSKIRKRFFYIMFNYQTNHIKFGISKNPTERTHKISMQSGQKIICIYYLKTCYARIIEKLLKEAFSDSKVKGEWYNVDKYDSLRLISYLHQVNQIVLKEKKEKPTMTRIDISDFLDDFIKLNK